MVDRAGIQRTLDELNSAENDPTLSAADKSAIVDRLSSPDVCGYLNGAERGDRDAERAQEVALWEAFPDYHREFRHVVIDPPVAAVAWVMAGSNAELGLELELHGSTIFEFDEDAKIHRFWLFFHDPMAS